MPAAMAVPRPASTPHDPVRRDATAAKALVPQAGTRLKRVALIGNFPPRRCGIATFTADCHASLATLAGKPAVDVYAMVDPGADYPFGPEVARTIRQNEEQDYLDAARAIEAGDYDALWVQHEFGIFGGDAGRHLLALLDAVDLPVVATLHTVLERPDPAQRAVMDALIARCERVVTMAERGREILRETYGAPHGRIALVPHGVPDRPRLLAEEVEGMKIRLGLPEEVIFTFGLLGPGKGLELMIDAMPAILRERPAASYVVLGATHPHLVAHEGEAYRDGLKRRARALGVDHAVQFIDRFAEFEDMLDHIQAADVYVMPYANEAQITSGTLAYAAALGKAIVATPFWHAQELLADGAGALVPFDDPDALADEIVHFLRDAALREATGRRAWNKGREAIWSRVAEGYEAAMLASVADRARSSTAPAGRHGPAQPDNIVAFSRPDVDPMLSLQTVHAMTDDTGILQHSRFAVPDRAHGYCLDDNARALVMTNEMAALGHLDTSVSRLAHTYAAFTGFAWDGSRFRNFMGYDRAWLEREGSTDSSGRGFLAVAHAAEHGLSDGLSRWARDLAPAVLRTVAPLTSPRSAAFVILGCAHLIRADVDRAEARKVLETRARHLYGQYRTERRDDWRWFEAYLSYDNARLPQALLAAAIATDNASWHEAALEALRWITERQTNADGQFRPVGTQSFGRRHAEPLPFDQQPLEAAAQIDACILAAEATGDGEWLERAERAYAWFFGENDLSLPLVKPEIGICHDGLHPDRVNLNQGAESVLAFQLATCAVLRARGGQRSERGSVRDVS